MIYSDMRAQFQALLNRTDCPDSLAKTFFTQSIQRIQRELRLPHNERILNVDTTTDVSAVDVPNDWIETKVFIGPNGEIRFLDVGSWSNIDSDGLTNDVYQNGTDESPFVYTRIGTAWYVKGNIPATSTAQIIYWGTETALVNDTDESTLASIAPDLIIAGAMTFALDYFTDERKQAWEQQFQMIAGTVQDQASDGEDRTGGAISAAYFLDDYS